MRDSRIGESLWFEWYGHEIYDLIGSYLVFYTEGHVDLENEVVARALASALQRDGVAISLGDGYKMLEAAERLHAYAGAVDGDDALHICDEAGETRDGDVVDDVIEITLVSL